MIPLQLVGGDVSIRCMAFNVALQFGMLYLPVWEDKADFEAIFPYGKKQSFVFDIFPYG